MLNINDLDVNKNVREACKERGISLRQLSEKINMSDMGLLKSLRNKSLRLETYVKISNVLNVDLLRLIFGKTYLGEDNVFETIKILQNRVKNLESDIVKNEKYIKALEDLNEKTKLLRDFENKEELSSFKRFVIEEEDHLKELSLPRIPGEKIIDFFLEYLAWKKDNNL